MKRKARVLTIMGWVFCLSISLYGALLVAAFLGQRAFIYPAPSRSVEPRVAGAELLRIAGPDGVAVYATYAIAPPGAPTLVHFHGNGEDLANQAWLVQAMAKFGVGVCAVEYPGYGLMRDVPLSEESVYATAEVALKHLAKLGVPPGSIVLQGQSLGTGVAAEMARRGYGARLVLISPYTSMVDMAALVAPFLPVRWLIRDRFETGRKAPSLALPALVIHGTNDALIPIEMGKRVAALLPNSEFFPVQGAHHADLFVLDERELLSKIVAFARGLAVESR
jgi:pimeloyl-ACP methyl ester carboxylesterase